MYRAFFRLMMLSALGLLNSGCVTMKEVGVAALEVPTVEAQANRIAVGSGILRINNYLLNHMPISADATWPAEISNELSEQARQTIERGLENDPWYATRHYSDAIQKQALGGLVSYGITPVTFTMYNKIRVLYGDNPNNWPDVMKYSPRLSQFLEFADARDKRPLRIEAASARQYPNLFAALVSLMPVNYQKELETSYQELQEAMSSVALLERDKGDLEKRLADDKTARAKDYEGELSPLSDAERAAYAEQIEVLETQIKEAEQVAEQKRAINFQLLDNALEALKSDINLSEENVMLAQNLQLALNQIKAGAGHAGTLYTVATAIMIGRGSFQNLPKELQTLAQATAYVPASQRSLMNARIARLTENVVYLFPALGMGTYYAFQQNSLAGKYGEVVGVVLEADASRKQQLQTTQTARQN